MLKALVFIPFLIILTIFVIYFLNKRILIAELKRLRNKGLNLLAAAKRFSEDNAYVLKQECQEIKNLLFDIDNILNKVPSNIELQELIITQQEVYYQLSNNIEEKKDQWLAFADFKNDVEFIKINLKSKMNELKQQEQLLILKEESYAEIINEKNAEIISSIKSLIKEFDALDKASFCQFNFYILEDLQNEYSELLVRIDKTFQELMLFPKKVQLKIVGLIRRSTCYITLEEKGQGRKKVRKGEIAVSYKTYQDALEGKKYKKDTYISNKRIASIQEIKMEFNVDDNLFRFARELNKEEFADIYLQLPVNINCEILDDNNFPLELNLNNLDIIVCQKEKNSFEVKYYLNYFAEIGINDLLSEYEQFIQ